MDTSYLDRYDKILEDGLVKVCQGKGVLTGGTLPCPDVEAKWNDYIKDYIADAVANFNDYSEAALAWAAFLGMGVAHNWDEDWDAHKNDPYTSYYGSRGWDDMDENILYNLLHLKKDYAAKISDALDSCALATLGLIRHEQIEAQTELGFYILSRSYTVMFRIGESIELERLGYRKVRLDKLGQ